MIHNVALVDDHHLMRNGLVTTVNALGNYRVTVEAGNGKELIEQLQDLPQDAPDKPHIAIVDLNMPVMDGYATMSWLREHAPEVMSLALTFDAAEDAMMRAVYAGARGFVLKTARPGVLKVALDSLALTGYYYTEELVEAKVRNVEWKNREDRERERILEKITPRELEFLLLVCDEDELTYEQIAKRMDIQRRSADNFRIALFDKFGIKSKTGLVLFAMRWGLLKVER